MKELQIWPKDKVRPLSSVVKTNNSIVDGKVEVYDLSGSLWGIYNFSISMNLTEFVFYVNEDDYSEFVGYIKLRSGLGGNPEVDFDK